MTYKELHDIRHSHSQRIVQLPDRAHSADGGGWPTISQCPEPDKPEPVINVSRIYKVLFVFFVVASLAVAHVYLRFTIADASLRHQQLQVRQRVLQSELSRLEREKSGFSDPQILHDYAVNDLRMVASDSSEKPVQSIPRNLVAKYSGDNLKRLNLRQDYYIDADQDQNRGFTFERVALALTDLNTAFAEIITSASEKLIK